MSFDPITLVLVQAAADCYLPNLAPDWQNTEKTCHVYKSVRNGVLTFAFEGTTDISEWLIDFDALQIQTSPDHPAFGPLHLVYWNNVQAAVDLYILPTLQTLGFPSYYVAGHSKGAGEATETHAYLKWLGHPPLAVRAYEPPRVGGPLLAAYLSGTDHEWTQTYNADGDDIVTTVPFPPKWAHIGSPIRLKVPDSYGIAQKHRIQAQQEALAA